MCRWPAVCAQVFLVVFLLSVGMHETVAENTAAWITEEQQKQIVVRLRAVLPPGWTITHTAMNRTPDDWYTLDSRGFEIDGQNGELVFQIWFLPKDWVGIRQVRPKRVRRVYWEGVLAGEDFKTVTNTDQVPVQESLQRLSMSTPSIVNGGWHRAETEFRDRIPEIEKQTQALVSHFCTDEPCRDEAAYSLIVLGIPARAVTLGCAAHAGEAQGFCVSALKYLGGPDSVQILEAVVSDPSTDPRVQMYAAMSLYSIADPSSGPALLRALRTISSPEAAQQVAEAIGRIRYELAAPELLSRMTREPPEAPQQAHYANALASLRYKPAIPAIERLCKTTQFSADWILQEQQERYLGWVPAIALMRLTASWGAPSGGIRLLLLPPEGPSAAGRVRVVAVIENVGDRDLDILGPPGGDVIVDGKKYEHRDSTIFDGNTTLRVNDVAAHAIDLSALIAEGGRHRVEYQRGTATSNQLTLQVSPALDDKR